MARSILGIVLFFLLTGIGSCQMPNVNSSSKPVDHQAWDDLLKKHVSPEGKVNYKGFIADSLALKSYMNLLEKNHPNNEHWNREEQMAYWINAYNAYTVLLIMQHYPVQSIKEIGGIIPFVNSSWDIKFIHIEGMEYDLNNIEHGILRKYYDEPRIHFAVNCASYSCPPLRAEAFTAQKLEAQLDEQAKLFINDPQRNKIEKERVEISKIFSWFKGDFTKKEKLITFLNRYSKVKIDEKAKVKHLDYNWNLNE